VAACDGCLGSERCWVCLGRGVLDSRAGVRPCHRCYGSGRCSLCRQINLVDFDLAEPPLLRADD
jgi:hypothetical protein